MSWELIDHERCHLKQLTYYAADHLWVGDYVQVDDGELGVVRAIKATGDTPQVTVKYQNDEVHKLSVDRLVRVWKNSNVDPNRAKEGFKLTPTVSPKNRRRLLPWQVPVIQELAKEARRRKLVPPLDLADFLALLEEGVEADKAQIAAARVGYLWLSRYPRHMFYKAAVEAEMARLGPLPSDTREQLKPILPGEEPEEKPRQKRKYTKREKKPVEMEPIRSAVTVRMDNTGYTFDQVAPPIQNYVNGVLGEGAMRVEELHELGGGNYDIEITHTAELPAITELMEKIQWLEDVRTKPLSMVGIA